MRPGRWKWLGVVGATSANPLDSGFRRNDECRGGGIQALLRLRSIIFVPMTGSGGATGSMYPGSESGTCFRINDD